jgi:hypothetical protein
MMGTQKEQEKGDTIYNSPPGLFPFPPVMGTKTIDIVIRAKTIDKVIRSKTIDMYIIEVLILWLLLLLMLLFTEQIPINEVNQVVIP